MGRRIACVSVIDGKLTEEETNGKVTWLFFDRVRSCKALCGMVKGNKEYVRRGTYPSARDGKAANDFCKLIEHGFWIPVIWVEHSVDRISDEHPLVSKTCQ